MLRTTESLAGLRRLRDYRLLGAVQDSAGPQSYRLFEQSIWVPVRDRMQVPHLLFIIRDFAKREM